MFEESNRKCVSLVVKQDQKEKRRNWKCQGLTVTQRKVAKRLRQPSKLKKHNSEKLDGISEQADRRRHRETFTTCQGILLQVLLLSIYQSM